VAVNCDGMGGGEGGEDASGTAAGTILAEVYGQLVSVSDVSQVPDILREAAWRSNRILFARAGGNGRMGTTLVMAAYLANPWLGDHVWVAHIGDSRAYALVGSDPTPMQITQDHSLVQQRVDAGEITADQAVLAEDANLITAALGVAPTPASFDIAYLPLCGQSVSLVLVTDGVWGPLLQAAARKQADLPDFPDYLATLLRSSSPAEAAARMVEDAILFGSTDNATCVAISIRQAAPTPVPGADTLAVADEADAPGTDYSPTAAPREGAESDKTSV
jgi:serine/threonine protein phosphatase PrpC